MYERLLPNKRIYLEIIVQLCPTIVAVYNQAIMGGTDKFEQYGATMIRVKEQ